MSDNELKNKSNIEVVRCKELLNYLMRNACGSEKKKSAKEIIKHFNSDSCVYPDVLGIFNTRQDIESTILSLRKVSDRKIGSSTSGYWMMCSDDKENGYSYLTNQAISKMKTAILCGVDPNVFYKTLNDIKPQCNKTIDGQLELDSNEETKRYSNDIKDIKEELHRLDFIDFLDEESNDRWDYLLQEISNIIEKAQNKALEKGNE